MSKFLTLEQFIKKAVDVHGSKYDYSKVEYISSKEKVLIGCEKHGFFLQRAGGHTKGQGCTKCKHEKHSKFLSTNKENFIKKCKELHGEKYSFENTEFINIHTRIKVNCSKHGEITVSPKSLLSGKGCIKCGFESRSSKIMLTKEEFIKKAILVWGDLYDYTNVEYKGKGHKIEFECKKHGKFEKSAKEFLIGQGCQKCSFEDRKNYTIGGWSDSNWENRGKTSSDFESFKIYLVKCFNDTESFYKIGKTFKKLYSRFAGNKVPYHYQVIQTIEGDAKTISELERTLHKECKPYKYTPQIPFKGQFECFLYTPEVQQIFNTLSK